MTHPFLDEVVKEIERLNFDSFKPYADDQDYSYAESYAHRVLDKHQYILDKQNIVIIELFTFIADAIYVKYSRPTYGETRICQLPLIEFIFMFISVEELRIETIETIINE